MSAAKPRCPACGRTTCQRNALTTVEKAVLEVLPYSDIPEPCDAVEAVAVARPIIAAETLRAFADANRFPADWIMFRREDGSGVTVGDMLRETARELLKIHDDKELDQC